MTDAELIRLIGEALFGRKFQTDLAHALGVSSRTVRRWVTGEDSPRRRKWVAMAELLRARERLIREILDGDDLAERIQQ